MSEYGGKMKVKTAHKVILWLCVFAILWVSFPAFASDVISDEKMTVTIGYAPYGMLETSVAKVKQFYKKYLPNVEVEWLFGLYSVHLINNWIAGKMEVSYLGDMPAIMLQDKVGNTRWVSNGVSPGGKVCALFVPANSTAKTIQDLQGKAVAVGIGSAQHRMLEVLAKAEGVKFDEVNQAPEVAIGNLEAGKVDGWAPWPPYIELAKFKKVGKLLVPDFTKYGAEENAIWPLVASEAFCKKHPKIVEGLVRADIDLHKFMKEHPDEAADIVFKQLEEKIPMPVVKASLASYDYSDQIGKEQTDTMQRAIDFLSEKKLIKKEFKAAEWADPAFVNQAMGQK
jgi:NitT/TauT family transport system substrate-binding protein